MRRECHEALAHLRAALALLDAHGPPVGAAHVAQAIDCLERRLSPQTTRAVWPELDQGAS